MKKIAALLLFSLSLNGFLFAQKEDDEKEKKPFKEHLFTGGSISLAFYNNTFLVGGSPVFGYNLTKWIDAGLVANYSYTSYRDYGYIFNNKLRQKVYGGGTFLKIYPVRFLFAQAQYEHNWITQKEIDPSGNLTSKVNFSGNSFLIGGGYCTGRESDNSQPFYYLAVLFDIADDVNSPYTDGYGRSIPIIRGGLQIPLFQKHSGRR